MWCLFCHLPGLTQQPNCTLTRHRTRGWMDGLAPSVEPSPSRLCRTKEHEYYVNTSSKVPPIWNGYKCVTYGNFARVSEHTRISFWISRDLRTGSVLGSDCEKPRERQDQRQPTRPSSPLQIQILYKDMERQRINRREATTTSAVFLLFCSICIRIDASDALNIKKGYFCTLLVVFPEYIFKTPSKILSINHKKYTFLDWKACGKPISWECK